MARKGKSWEDIRIQANRLYDMNSSSYRHSPRRDNWISSITSRYLTNLQKTKTVKNARRQLLSMDKSKRQDLMDKVANKKFSRSAYMGTKSKGRVVS